MGLELKITEDIFQEHAFHIDSGYVICGSAIFVQMRSKVNGQGHDQTKYDQKIHFWLILLP